MVRSMELLRYHEDCLVSLQQLILVYVFVCINVFVDAVNQLLEVYNKTNVPFRKPIALISSFTQAAIVLVLWYGGKLVNEHELNVGILTGDGVLKGISSISIDFAKLHITLSLTLS